MSARMALLAAGLALALGGCADFGFDDDEPVVAGPNGCTAAGCPQAAGFCTARGYQQGTDAYNRCLVSVDENLRRGE